NVVFIDELLDEIGVDAARWYLVNRGPDQTIDIDVDLAAEKSQKNPVYYVQYAHARIAGILRQAPGSSDEVLLAGSLAAEERNLIKRLAEFPAVVRDAAAKRGPQSIPVDTNLKPLGWDEISGILPKGGTIIGTSRTNPYKLDGGVDGVRKTFEQLDALVAIGGEDTLGVAARLSSEFELPVVGVPKTIDN